VLDCSQVAEQLLSGLKHVPTGLEATVARRFGIALDKTYQKAGWDASELSEGQIRYAATDAAVTLRLWAEQERGIGDDGCGRAYALARAAQPVVAAMRLAGVPFDRAAHEALIDGKRPERERLFARVSDAFRGNPRSYARFDAWLLYGLDETGLGIWPRTDSGHLRSDVDTLRNCVDLLPERDRPVVLDLLAFRDLDKLVTTYGVELAGLLRAGDDRFSPGLRVGAAVSGRMTCSAPNLQNIPRDPAFRGLFRPREGRAFVTCDYGQMELRVAAEVAGEDAMRRVLRLPDPLAGDLHCATASLLTGKPADAVTKEERARAKAINFGMLFGMGAAGLRSYAKTQYGVSLTPGQAEDYRARWLAAYPAIARWQDRTGREGRRELRVSTTAGRKRRWLSRRRDEANGFRATEAVNFPVQGGAAEALLAALARLDAALGPAGLDAVPILTVHDEVLLEASEADAPAAKALLERCMLEGALELFPDMPTERLVEAKVGKSWAEK